MSGLDVYGLRAAKRIVREMRAAFKGRTSEYIKGYREALREAERLFGNDIDRILARPADTKKER